MRYCYGNGYAKLSKEFFQFQLIFKFFFHSRGQKQTVGDTVNLASRLKIKKKKWKVTVNPEEKEDDDEENLKKEIM